MATKTQERTKQRQRYPDDVREAVREANSLRAAYGRGYGAGPKQHLATRQAVAKLAADGGSEVTSQAIAELAGVSLETLHDIAIGKAPAADMVPLRHLARAIKGDAWQRGRHLAAQLWVYAEQLEREAAVESPPVEEHGFARLRSRFRRRGA